MLDTLVVVYPGWEGVPGVGIPGWGLGGSVGGLYRYPGPASPRAIFSTILASGPYPRPNEGNSRVFHEVSQDGSRMGPDMGPDMASE